MVLTTKTSDQMRRGTHSLYLYRFLLHVCVFFTLIDRASTMPSNMLYVVANPVRGLLDRKISDRNIYKAPTKA